MVMGLRCSLSRFKFEEVIVKLIFTPAIVLEGTNANGLTNFRYLRMNAVRRAMEKVEEKEKAQVNERHVEDERQDEDDRSDHGIGQGSDQSIGKDSEEEEGEEEDDKNNGSDQGIGKGSDEDSDEERTSLAKDVKAMWGHILEGREQVVEYMKRVTQDASQADWSNAHVEALKNNVEVLQHAELGQGTLGQQLEA